MGVSSLDKHWVVAETKKRQSLIKNGMYDSSQEHDACGVGLVVSIDGEKSRQVVEKVLPH